MSLDNDKILSSLKITAYDFDPNATTATDVSFVDMRDLYSLCVMVFRTVGTSTMTLTIVANTDSDGGGDEETIATKTFTAGQPDAVGDYVFLEVLAEQIRTSGDSNDEALRYVSAKISFETATDEAVVAYIAKPRFKFDGLSADLIST